MFAAVRASVTVGGKKIRAARALLPPPFLWIEMPTREIQRRYGPPQPVVLASYRIGEGWISLTPNHIWEK